jgi:DNA polymerase III subunit epsilon
MDFCALDVETANAIHSSVCQIGISKFRAGEVVDELSILIDPETHFDDVNISIHGITEEAVKGELNFSDAWDNILDFIQQDIIVSHTTFDKIALNRACTENVKCFPDNQWVDSTQVVRRVWKKYEKKGYGLKNLSKEFNIVFQHHDALSDARTCGVILVRAIIESGTNLDSWVPAGVSTANPKPGPTFDGTFQGQYIVFTGGMLIPRREAAKMATDIGFDVVSGVSKKVSVLVVGDQDTIGIKGGGSSKHRKAEELICISSDLI